MNNTLIIIGIALIVIGVSVFSDSLRIDDRTGIAESIGFAAAGFGFYVIGKG